MARKNSNNDLSIMAIILLLTLPFLIFGSTKDNRNQKEKGSFLQNIMLALDVLTHPFLITLVMLPVAFFTGMSAIPTLAILIAAFTTKFVAKQVYINFIKDDLNESVVINSADTTVQKENGLAKLLEQHEQKEGVKEKSEFLKEILAKNSTISKDIQASM